jgi:hypothetical protein
VGVRGSAKDRQRDLRGCLDVKDSAWLWQAFRRIKWDDCME